jgi:DNA-binding transcriptional MocR family regulator
VRFDTPEPARLRTRAPDHVIYVDSLSKTIAGGLRVGWVAANGEVRRRLTELKLATDYHTPVLTQHLAQRCAGDAPPPAPHQRRLRPPLRGDASLATAPAGRRAGGDHTEGRPSRVGDIRRLAAAIRAFRRTASAHLAPAMS